MLLQRSVASLLVVAVCVSTAMLVVSFVCLGPAPSQPIGLTQATEYFHPELEGLLQVAGPFGSPFHFPLDTMFSVIIWFNGHTDHVLQNAPRFLEIPSVHLVLIRVQAPMDVPEAIHNMCKRHPRLKVDVVSSSLRNRHARFALPQPARTDWVFTVSDYVTVHPEEVEWAFDVAQRYPARLTGFVPRFLRQVQGRIVSRMARKSEHHARYNMILPDGGAFMNTRWLHVFSDVINRNDWDVATESSLCLDVAINMVVSHTTSLAPVFVVGTATEVHGDVDNDYELESCAEQLMFLFHANPLKPSVVMVPRFTYDVPALKQLMWSTKLVDGDINWWPRDNFHTDVRKHVSKQERLKRFANIAKNAKRTLETNQTGITPVVHRQKRTRKVKRLGGTLGLGSKKKKKKKRKKTKLGG